MGQPGPFKIVLRELETGGPDSLGNPNLGPIKRELARLFHLDEAMAGDICTAMPIVIVDGLDGHQIGVVRGRLQKLASLGVVVIATDEESDTIPRVNWPELPEVAQVDPPAPAPDTRVVGQAPKRRNVTEDMQATRP